MKKHVHIHVPEGAVPKDGPSAGVAMTTALASAFLNQPVRRDIAMTGEVTLRGRVLPIGGLKEKLIAAHRAGIKKVFIPHQTKRTWLRCQTMLGKICKLCRLNKPTKQLSKA